MMWPAGWEALGRWGGDAAHTSQSFEIFRSEMGAVGWFFALLKFGGAWALTQLRRSLEISGHADPDREVVECLAALAPEHPLTTVECLGMMADGDKEGWRIQYWGNLVWIILSAALRSDDVAAQEYAVALINRLGSRGFLEYQDLLTA